MMIWIGFYIAFIGGVICICGIQTELNNKMVNNTDYTFSIGTLTFADGFVVKDDKGNISPKVTYIAAEKIEKKEK